LVAVVVLPELTGNAVARMALSQNAIDRTAVPTAARRCMPRPWTRRPLGSVMIRRKDEKR